MAVGDTEAAVDLALVAGLVLGVASAEVLAGALGAGEEPAEVALAGLIGDAALADAGGAVLFLPAGDGFAALAYAVGDVDDVEEALDGLGGLAPALLVALDGLLGEAQDVGHLVLGNVQFISDATKRLA